MSVDPSIRWLAPAENGPSPANSNRVSPKKSKRSSASGLANYDTFATWEPVTENRRRHDQVIRRCVWKPLPKARLEEVRCRKKRVYVKGQHSCWRHCDFPSECLHTIQAAAARNRNHPSCTIQNR
jgi:hypothetical protein